MYLCEMYLGVNISPVIFANLGEDWMLNLRFTESKLHAHYEM